MAQWDVCDICCRTGQVAGNKDSWQAGVLQLLCDLINAATSGGIIAELNAVYNVIPPAPADGEEVALQTDDAGNLKVYLASLLFGENDTVDTSASGTGTLGVTQNPAYSSKYSPLSDLQSAVISRTSANTANKNLLKGYTVQNTTAALLYFQVWDGASVGAGTLKDFVPVPAGSATVPGTASKGSKDFGENGLFCATGISWGWSTTPTTYTAVGAGTGLTTQLYYQTN